MTVKELSEKSGFEPICLPDGEREINGCYCGDLLSWVMGRAKADQAWITIMSNVNIVAVATLCDTSCIILSENVALDDDIKAVAEAKDVNILKTALPTYEAAKALSEII